MNKETNIFYDFDKGYIIKNSIISKNYIIIIKYQNNYQKQNIKEIHL